MESPRLLSMANPHLSPSLGSPSTTLRPYTGHHFPNSFRSENPDGEDWRTWSFVALKVFGLPKNVTTKDVHEYISRKRFGNVSRIRLLESRQGGEISSAEVVIKPPPPKRFWGSNSHKFGGSDGHTYFVQFRLEYRQRKVFEVKSPVREVQFPEEIMLRGSALGFGVLSSEKEMMVMKTVTAESETNPGSPPASVYLMLNLRQREIRVHFPVLLKSKNVSRTRDYRFPVSFDESFSIWKVNEIENGSQAYIIHVRNPPWYSRRLETLQSASHYEGAKVWNEDDLWTRQTDIVTHKDDFAAINKTPVSLKKTQNRINIARCTTFKLDVDSSKNTDAILDIFDNALKDFNIRVKTQTSDSVVRTCDKDAAPYWDDVEFTGNGQDFWDDGCTLPFELRYQLEVCISNGRLSEYSINKAFLLELKRLRLDKAKQILIHVDSIGEEIKDPMTIFKDIRFQKPVRSRQIPRYCSMVHHATITATSIKVSTPTVEVSNRVIRKYEQYADHFLRVRFEDDEYRGQTKLYPSSNSKMKLVIARVKRALLKGITIAGRHYEFLAYGNSQLRDHGAYFFANTNDLTADMIRTEMGVFDNEKIVAKRAARMGQCFSTTQPIHYRLPPITEENVIPDVMHNGYNFTDGVGRISPLAATLAKDNLDISGEATPSCFQFRLGGCKGVLTLDPSLKGITVQIRRSQFKFQSKSQELEIIKYSQFWQPFLNRQIIIILSQLGVKDKVFLDKQKATIKALDKAMNDDTAALQALRTNVDPNQMTVSMCELVSSGFRQSKEPFVMSLMELWRAWTLIALKEKAKIPVKDGAFVLGTVDETNTLRGHLQDLPNDAPRAEKEKHLPEIFLQIFDPVTREKKVVEGVCILARNPSLHPGDIRIVKAVDVLTLRHLCDVVVMPQNGIRDIPSMCSGGDLDGDDYIVIWDPTLIPDIWNLEPHHYEAPIPKTVEGDITTKDIIDFFVDYLENDSLGRIAHAHLGNADYFDDGLRNYRCIELVQLHSESVDYPKTGVPAKLDRRLEPVQWPHFMEKRGRFYRSEKILGRLFDEVKDLVTRFDFRARYSLEFDSRILTLEKPEPDYFREVEIIKHEYDMSLRRIMAQHKIKTEFEVWTTFVMAHSKKSRDYKFHEEIGRISKTLKDEYRGELVKAAGGSDYDRLAPYALAAYQFTAEQVTNALRKSPNPDPADTEEASEGDETASKLPKVPFCSFPWLLSDVLGKIVSTPKANNPASVGNAAKIVAQTHKADVKLSTGIASAESKTPNLSVTLTDDGCSESFQQTLGNTSPTLPSPTEPTGSTIQIFSLADWTTWATKGNDSRPSSRDSSSVESKTRPPPLDLSTIDFLDSGSASDTWSGVSNVSKSEAYDGVFRPRETPNSDLDVAKDGAKVDGEGARASEDRDIKSKTDSRVQIKGMMSDPFLLSEEQKAALLAEDDDF